MTSQRWGSFCGTLVLGVAGDEGLVFPFDWNGDDGGTVSRQSLIEGLLYFFLRRGVGRGATVAFREGVDI